MRLAQDRINAKQIDGTYKGRPKNVAKNTNFLALLNAGASWSAVCRATEASRTTLSRLVNQRAAAAARATLKLPTRGLPPLF